MTPAKVTPVPMLDFSRQFATIREEVLAAVETVLTSQRFILGPEVESFERSAALSCGVPHAIGCASGTDALWLAMAAAGVGPGDAVVTSPFSFFATVSSILRCGARPVLADIDPQTFNLSPQTVGELLRGGETIKAVLPVHLYGQCADWDAFSTLREEFGVTLVEDAAQAFGAEWRGVKAGALGASAAFSFYPTKNLAAVGDAGLVTTSSESIDERVRSLRAHGMKRRYYHDEVGWNSRLDTIQAAVLEVKLKYLPEGNRKRRALAAGYAEMFAAAGLTGKGIVLPFEDSRGTHVYHQYVIRAPKRDALRAFLAERKIGTEVYYPLSLHQQVSLVDLGYKTGDFPESERAAEEVLALPMYPELRSDEQEIVVGAIAEFFR
ncbi:DegT/DnrJ/EryC1/StrS family aminotransferase [Granulicella pectinivorans]|uniref:DegT/DnrJ/EryC1/StrS family aminotransferase n=1 Tax=Granulicella pectinivorans TaxID=474950 RepID=UPI0031830DDB